ncbi:MAG: PIN domain-containing protein [Bacteroidetes bacterium]|jgi:predicted nucleic acid-binding protein|nr:PIN domain-containing protein [Bacteroidota bacterium]
MGKEYLIDTNVLIEYIGNLLPEKSYSFISGIIDQQFTISVINKIEVLGHNTAGKDIEDFIGLADIIELTEEITNKTIELRKQYKTKLPDAIIAATALVNELTIITRNTKDFEKIEGLEVLNPNDN